MQQKRHVHLDVNSGHIVSMAPAINRMHNMGLTEVVTVNKKANHFTCIETSQKHSSFKLKNKIFFTTEAAR